LVKRNVHPLKPVREDVPMTRTVLQGGQVFDSITGEVTTADVVIEGQRIVDVGPGLDGDDAVNVSGRTLLPGMFDCHTHLVMQHFDYLRLLTEPFSLQFFYAIQSMRQTLDIGITTVRDAWGADAGVKAAVERGMVPGPRMRITISMVAQTGGHADSWSLCGADLPILPAHPGRPKGVADGAGDLRHLVRQIIRAGADGIKVAASGGVLSVNTDPHLPQLDEIELTAIVDEATMAGKWVMAHCHSAAGARNAVRAGVRSIDHGSFLDDDVLGLMAERGTWFVPTLLAAHGVVAEAEAGKPMPAGIEEKARDAAASASDAVRRAVDAGVTIAMGTDCPVSPHGTNLRELELMANAGLSPAGCLQAATVNAARLLQVDHELGSLEPGKRADVVVVDGDVFDFAGLAANITQVWKDGIVVRG
jgi:imidazolonepropionase-like amidohydrolase